MIRISRDDVERIFWSDWKSREVWIGTTVFLGEDAKEEHRFWAQVADVSSGELTLAGEYTLLRVPLADAVFEYGEPGEAPEDKREIFSDFDCLLTIRSQNVAAFLFGSKPKGD